MGLWMLLPVGAFVAVAWLLATSAGGLSRRAGNDEAAREILARRLAAGEIDLGEYENARAAIDLSEPAWPPAE